MSDRDFRYCPRCGSHSGIRRRAGNLLKCCALCNFDLTTIIAALDIATTTSDSSGKQANSERLNVQQVKCPVCGIWLDRIDEAHDCV